MTPSAPAIRALRARSTTRSWMLPSLIRAAFRSSRSRDVRIVTARIFVLLSPRPATAARTTYGSPWTVRKSRLYCAMPATAFSTVAPMSKNFMSRKTLAPRSLSSFARARPPPVNMPRPIL